MEIEEGFVSICTKPPAEKERGAQTKHGRAGAEVYKLMSTLHGSTECGTVMGVSLQTMWDLPSFCSWISALFAFSEKINSQDFPQSLKCWAVRQCLPHAGVKDHMVFPSSSKQLKIKSN